MEKIRAAIYARFSSHNQREESIDQQLRVCRQWAQANGFTVVAEYTDSAVSGTTDKRPGFQQMIYESEKRKWQVLLVYSHDRFARNRYDAATYKARLKKHGVRVVAVTMPLDDSPESVLIESLMEGYAEYYSVNLSRNVKRGLSDNAINGRSNGGLPLGYKAEDGQIKLDPVGAMAIRLIFDEYDAGTNKTEIVRMLADRGFKSRQGNNISYNSLYKILQNKRYTGMYIYEDVRIPDGIPQIVSQDQFKRVQEKIKSRKRSGRKVKNMEFLLSGKLYCGCCGKPMIGDSGTSANGTTYYYYTCSGKKHKQKCPKKNERMNDMDTAVLDYICDVALTDDNITMIARECFALLDSECQNKAMLASYQSQLADTTAKIDNIMAAIEQGIFTQTTKERLEQLEELKADLECKIVSEQLKRPEFTVEHIEFWLHSFKGGHVQDPDFARQLVDSLVNSVFVYDDDESKRLVIALNLKNTPTKTLTCSDVLKMVDHQEQYPNMIIQKTVVVFIVH